MTDAVKAASAVATMWTKFCAELLGKVDQEVWQVEPNMTATYMVVKFLNGNRQQREVDLDFDDLYALTELLNLITPWVDTTPELRRDASFRVLQNGCVHLVYNPDVKQPLGEVLAEAMRAE